MCDAPTRVGWYWWRDSPAHWVVVEIVWPGYVVGYGRPVDRMPPGGEWGPRIEPPATIPLTDAAVEHMRRHESPQPGEAPHG